MTRPRSILIGVPRAGTTSAYRYLGQHPGLFTSAMKEINFLAYPGHDGAATLPWVRFRVTTLEEYEALFRDADGRLTVDVSPACFSSPVAPDRIARFVPE